jgi:hypothetical protein
MKDGTTTTPTRRIFMELRGVSLLLYINIDCFTI